MEGQSNINGSVVSNMNFGLSTVGPGSLCNTTGNHTCSDGPQKSLMQDMFNQNKGMLMRTLYVLVAVTAILVIYFILRTARLRRQSKTRKYGIISRSDLEMTPLDQSDNEDDDISLFDRTGHK